MYDLKLTEDGDLEIGENGDIGLTQSVRQKVAIRLRWLFSEWRFAPTYGVPYLQEIMVKKPDMARVRQIIREEIMDVEGMTDVRNLEIRLNSQRRVAAIVFDGTADGANFSEEVKVSARVRNH